VNPEESRSDHDRGEPRRCWRTGSACDAGQAEANRPHAPAWLVGRPGNRVRNRFRLMPVNRQL